MGSEEDLKWFSGCALQGMCAKRWTGGKEAKMMIAMDAVEMGHAMMEAIDMYNSGIRPPKTGKYDFRD